MRSGGDGPTVACLPSSSQTYLREGLVSVPFSPGRAGRRKGSWQDCWVGVELLRIFEAQGMFLGGG